MSINSKTSFKADIFGSYTAILQYVLLNLLLFVYSSVMRILPRDMRPYVKLEDIVILHKSMSDLMPGQAVLQFIEVLKAWPLFGASVFEISVCWI